MRNPSTTVRFKNVRIDLAATTSFPEMVQVVKTPTRLNAIKGKKYVTLKMAKIAIDTLAAYLKIDKYRMGTDEKELRTLNY